MARHIERRRQRTRDPAAAAGIDTLDEASRKSDAAPSALLLENDQGLAVIISKRLTEAGFDVAHVTTGDDGLAFVLEHQPVLVIVNLRLERISGLDFLTLLRYVTNPKEMRIVAIDDSGDHAVPELSAYGVEDVIPATRVPQWLDHAIRKGEHLHDS